MKFKFFKGLGAILLLIGTVVSGGGGYFMSNEECQYGAVLDIRPIEESETTDLEGNLTQFSNLPPDEQRIFLEAYTDDADLSGISRVYQEWNESWFARETHTPLYVSYQGTYFRTLVGHVDCGIDEESLLQGIGLITLYLGAVVLGLTSLFQLIKKE